jgi:hypothetical protein
MEYKVFHVSDAFCGLISWSQFQNATGAVSADTEEIGFGAKQLFDL